MKNLRLWISIAAILCITALVVIIGFQYKVIKKTERQLEQKTINFNALENEYNHISSRNIEYKMNIAQLSTSLDSLNMKMNEVRRELKVKDSEIRRLGYIASIATKTDTIVVKDTIFKNNVNIDTLITDGEWYKLHLHFSYPNEVVVSPEFKSEKVIVTSARRVILNPKKCAIARWFQKKSTIVETEVVENNPYITNTKERFLEVIE